MAVQSLRRSNEFAPVRLNISTGPIGTGKVRNFLLNRPLVTVLNKQISKKDKNGVWVLRSEFRNI